MGAQGLLPRPPEGLLDIGEGKEMVLSVIKSFLDEYAPYDIIMAWPRKGHSPVYIELASGWTALRVSSRQVDEKTETITLELIKLGTKNDDRKVVDSVEMHVKSTGLLRLVYEDMMWYELELQLRKKYCYSSEKRQGDLIVELYSRSACYPSDEEDE